MLLQRESLEIAKLNITHHVETNWTNKQRWFKISSFKNTVKPKAWTIYSISPFRLLPCQNKNSLLLIREPLTVPKHPVVQSPYSRSRCQLRSLRLVMSWTNLLKLNINSIVSRSSNDSIGLTYEHFQECFNW